MTHLFAVLDGLITVTTRLGAYISRSAHFGANDNNNG